jgi:phage tail-like protein
MNANRQRFWMLADARDWAIADGMLDYDDTRRLLTLARRRPEAAFSAARADAEAALLRVPHTLDEHGARAWFEGGRIMALGLSDYAAPQALRTGLGDITDLAIAFNQAPGSGSILHAAEAGNLRLIDLRGRWDDLTLQALDFSVERIAAAPTGGVWALDRARRLLARSSGSPRTPDPVAYAASTARPCTENPDPPRLIVLAEPLCADTESPVALACNARGEVAVLIWRADGACDIALHDASGRRVRRVNLSDLGHAHAIAWMSDTRIACLVAGVAEAPVFDLADTGSQLEPSGDYHPLRNHDGGPFLNAHLPKAHFMAGGPAPEAMRVKPLARLSLPAYVARGQASNARALDSGLPGHDWHRLYLEAVIPDGCAVRVWLAASDDGLAPAADDGWFEHRFGAAFATARDADIAHGAWVAQPSELPHHAGLLPCAAEAERAGLFTALIQRPGRAVRTLRGRYLHVRLQLAGNGRASPAIAALRAWGARFSYVDRYLPEFYREALTGPARDAPGAATGADFLERMLGNFEGVLTPLEDRIAHAHLLADPATAPDAALPWLARWIGLAFDPVWPPARRRALLAVTPELYRAHGTRHGLDLALDAATGGAVSGGEIVVIEDFRLRRTFATILGADLADEHDPLFDGLVASANSIVGDTLFLGDAERAELLSLFAPEVGDAGAEAAVLAFFEQLAHRACVLVHRDIVPQDLGLIRRVAETMSPAHVEVRVLAASNPLLVGLSALIGIDTYLKPKPRPPLARLDQVAMGYALIEGDASLVAEFSSDPVADIRIGGGGPRVELGESFTLSGAASRAGPERRIARYRWTWVE